MRLFIFPILPLIVLSYAFSLSISALNEHFDTSPPQTLHGTVIGKSTRYNPWPINVLAAQIDGNRQIPVDVLKETSDKLPIASPVEIVAKRGLFGKTWYQDKAFYESLGDTRLFQGSVHAALFAFLLFCCFRVARRRFQTSTALGVTLGCVVIASSYFALAP